MRRLVLIAFLLAGCGKVPPVALHPAGAPPDRLSDWAVVMSDGDYVTLNEGVTPYELNTPLFSDYALKLRTVWLPADVKADYRDVGVFEFPVGTIISKTFHYEKAAGFTSADFRVAKHDRESRLDSNGRINLDDYVLVETRLLVRYADGWQAFPYVWTDQQDEAWLEVAGAVREMTHVSDSGDASFVYIVPDANQCAGCHVTNHASRALQPIGPRAWQMNRQYAYQDASANQLERWQELGLLQGVEAQPPVAANWSDPGSASLEQRARAYLDINCAHCHNENGPADTSALDLDLATPTGRVSGLCKPPVAVGRGSGDRPYDIYPGRPGDSILLFRMQHSDPAIAMPELGRSTVHDEGVAVVSDWIASLDGEC